MIKLIAAVFMVADHIGYIFFPDILMWRLIGRLSMPLFAYGIAKGYGYSRQKGTLHRYLKNLVLFTTVSQIPFYLMAGKGWNIGLTWVFSLLLLIILDRTDMSRPRTIVECVGVLAAAYVFDVDYGTYGVLMPLVMRQQRNDRKFLYMTALWAAYVAINGVGGLIQVLSCICVPLLAVMEPWDGKIYLPRRFFYIFYPTHILILLLINRFL